MKKYKYSVYKIFSFTALLIITILVFNYVMDPYQRNILTIKGINDVKPVIDERGIKYNHLLTTPAKYDGYIIGPSWTTTLDPDIAKEKNLNFYNLGISGGMPEEIYGQLLFLKDIGKLPKYLIYGVSPKFFGNNYEMYFNTHPLIKKYLGRNHNYIKEYLNFSYLKLSILTLKKSMFYENKLFILKNNGIRKYIEEPKRGRINSSITSKIKEYTNFKFSTERLNYLKKIIDFSKENNINLKIYISPTNKKFHDEIYIKRFNNIYTTFLEHLNNSNIDLILFNYLNINFEKEENFFDATHFNEKISNFIMTEIIGEI